MKILLTNDDGYDAVGLKALIKALTPIYDMVRTTLLMLA